MNGASETFGASSRGSTQAQWESQKEKNKGTQILFEEIMGVNSPNLMKKSIYISKSLINEYSFIVIYSFILKIE